MNLLDFPVTQIALSIMISWALYAVFIGLLQESIAQIMAERGRFMKVYLLKQLQDTSNGINWASLLYLHGAIDLLSRETNKPTNDINPKLFSKVLVEVMGSAQIVQMKGGTNSYTNPLLHNIKNATGVLLQSDVVSFVTLALANAEIAGTDTSGVRNEAIIYQNLLDQIENWYKEFGERLSLWYKKRMRKKLFVIGVIVSILINVDSVQLYNFYKVTPKSRTAVENYYINYVADSGKTHPKLLPNALSTERSLDSLVKVADLPIGFDYNIFKQKPSGKYGFVWKILGILISGFAASFGAPFWFDVLKKIYSSKIQFT